MSERRRPLWHFLTAAMIGLPVLYVASFGPACWISSRTANTSMLIPYRSLIRAGTRTVDQPKLYRTPLQQFLKSYADLGSDNFSTFCEDRIQWTIFQRH